jgi:peptidoglycan/xylan/chitin deacetylase (PgdA/CDA1 family)
MAHVPVLITWDVDPDRWATFDHRQKALSKAIDLCEELGIKSTFFFTADFAHEYPHHIERVQALGQEIGCHGLTHTDEEDYDRMPEDMQRAYIEEATRKLEAVTGTPILSFRGPRVKTSALALRLLAERGYRADSSVCSQRIDFVSSNLINGGWILAPRRPYHPRHTSAFKRGDIPIWEIPVSAMVLPFLSGSLNVFGLRFMKAFFRLLYMESRCAGKPVVYLAHPTEFISSDRRRKDFTHKMFSPTYIRTHGFLIRRVLYRMNGETWFNATREMFAYMASFPGVTFMTSGEYANYLEDSAGAPTRTAPARSDRATSRRVERSQGTDASPRSRFRFSGSAIGCPSKPSVSIW